MEWLVVSVTGGFTSVTGGFCFGVTDGVYDHPPPAEDVLMV